MPPPTGWTASTQQNHRCKKIMPPLTTKLTEHMQTDAREGAALRRLQQQTGKLQQQENELQRARNKFRTHGISLTPAKPPGSTPPPPPAASTLPRVTKEQLQESATRYGCPEISPLSFAAPCSRGFRPRNLTNYYNCFPFYTFYNFYIQSFSRPNAFYVKQPTTTTISMAQREYNRHAKPRQLTHNHPISISYATGIPKVPSINRAPYTSPTTTLTIKLGHMNTPLALRPQTFCT